MTVGANAQPLSRGNKPMLQPIPYLAGTSTASCIVNGELVDTRLAA